MFLQLNRQKKRRENPRERAHFNILGKNYNNVRRARERGDSEDIIKRYQNAIHAEFLKYEDEKKEGAIDERTE